MHCRHSFKYFCARFVVDEFILCVLALMIPLKARHNMFFNALFQHKFQFSPSLSCTMKDAEASQIF